ncbi:MAG: thioredoxin family protein [Clostridiales bacterium]|nr:thioredoxin family protein [Clostridiales bacterium]
MTRRINHDLNEACIAAVKELGMDLKLEYITDMEKFVSYSVMSMPALVINEKVVSMGKALKTAGGHQLTADVHRTFFIISD